MIDEKKIEEAAINTSIEDTNKGRVREDYVISAMADHELGFQDGFKSGIDWFLDNLWHDASEEPEEGKRLLVVRTFTGEKSYAEDTKKSLYKNWQTKVNKEEITRWLYIEDLMKGGK